MTNPFKQGDKVKFADSDLNRAECAIYMDKVLIVNKACVDGLLFLHNTKIKDISDLPTMMYHHSRFELVTEPLKFEVGDWVEADNGLQLKVVSTVPDDYDGFIAKTPRGYSYGFYNDGRCVNLAMHVFNGMPVINIIRKLSPSEVILDFGNGIKGCIKHDDTCPCDDRGLNNTSPIPCHIIVQDAITGYWSKIYVKMLTEPMKSIVLDLLKAQEKEV